MTIEQQTGYSDYPVTQEARFHLIGGGIASLAAAVFLIRDGKIAGRNITIFGDQPKPGGSLEGAGSPETGYVARGGRVLEAHYVCTYDLFSSIPALDGSRSVTQEIFACNEALKTYSHARLVRDGRKLDSPEFGLTEGHRLRLIGLALSPENVLGSSAIEDHFDKAFFKTDFWAMWATTFAFQPWHSAVEMKRYLMRFVHMMQGFNRLQGIMRTTYNQYDSMVRPLAKWLDDKGVNFVTGTVVSDIRFERIKEAQRPSALVLEREGRTEEVELGSDDYVIVTLGSMADLATLGGMDTPPPYQPEKKGAGWRLWEKISEGRPEFGRPSAFDNRPDQSKWVSFTGTLRDPAFFRIVKDFTGNVPGEGGLITFADFGLAPVDHDAAAAALHRPAGGYRYLLGLRPFDRQPRRLREKTDGGLHRTRDHDRSSGPSWRTEPGGRCPGQRDRSSAHDALCHERVSDAIPRRPPARDPEGLVEPRLGGPVLRAGGRHGVHRRVFRPLSSGRGLLAPAARSRAARGLQGSPQPDCAVSGFHVVAELERVRKSAKRFSDKRHDETKA